MTHRQAMGQWECSTRSDSPQPWLSVQGPNLSVDSDSFPGLPQKKHQFTAVAQRTGRRRSPRREWWPVRKRLGRVVSTSKLRNGTPLASINPSAKTNQLLMTMMPKPWLKTTWLVEQIIWTIMLVKCIVEASQIGWKIETGLKPPTSRVHLYSFMVTDVTEMVWANSPALGTLTQAGSTCWQPTSFHRNFTNKPRDDSSTIAEYNIV